ncbi:MAG: glycosyltransferase family 39 protein [Microbacter sp.]
MKQKEIIGVILLFSLLRLILTFMMGLMPQDAYYFYYSTHLSLSYFDHPPMIAYMLKFFTLLLGKSALTLHLADFIVTSFTLIIFYRFLQDFLQGEALRKAFLLIATTPLMTVLSINSTPDVPLLFFWALTLLMLHRAIKSNQLIHWIWGGILVGLTFDSKYTGIFAWGGMFLFLLLSQKHRKTILSLRFFLFTLFFVITALPVIIWNVDNHFISFKYQSTQRAAGIDAFHFQPILFLGSFGSQLLLVLPVFYLFIFKAAYELFRKWLVSYHLDEKELFAASFALPIILFFTFISFFYWVKINWMMPAFLSAAILTVRYFKTWKAIYWQMALSLLIHVLAIVEIGWMPFPVHSDDTWWGWKQLADRVTLIHQQHPNDFLFSDDSYKTAAVLNFYLPEKVYAGNIIEQDAYQFALNDTALHALSNQNAIYITSSLNKHNRSLKNNVQSYLLKYFRKVEPMDSILLKDRNGKTQRRFAVYHCQHYMPPANSIQNPVK